MNLTERLEQAREVFSREYATLQSTTGNRSVDVPIPVAVLHEMPTLGIAISVIHYFSGDQIEELVHQGIAHPSTYRGGSFSIAIGQYRNYMSDFKPLQLCADDLEQLYRTCNTAKKIVEKGLF